MDNVSNGTMMKNIGDPPRSGETSVPGCDADDVQRHRKERRILPKEEKAGAVRKSPTENVCSLTSLAMATSLSGIKRDDTTAQFHFCCTERSTAAPYLYFSFNTKPLSPLLSYLLLFPAIFFLYIHVLYSETRTRPRTTEVN